ncbi:MAG TPA: 4-hydroxybenzoyl-CoA reductase subunit beta [Xanthobacteraceae bacterium]|nr:4-hydroxybenzoyl-CoA reductase subunit beta [Xanthobacteraceae bacterium]
MTAPIAITDVVRPHDVAGAISVCCENANSRFIAGGTDLMVNIRHGIQTPSTLIDLTGIDEMAAIAVDSSEIRIGAGVTIAALARHPDIAAVYPAIVHAAERIAAPGHRALGTVGGNLCLDTRCIYYNQSEWWRSANGYCLKRQGEVCHVAPQGGRCHAAFTGDLAPVFLALDAAAEIANSAGRRRIPLAEMYVEDGRAHLRLAADDLVVAVRIPVRPLRSAYAKVRLRGAIDYPLAGVAVALAAERGALTSLRIGITGTNSRPFLLKGTDNFAGRPVDENVLQDIDRLVQRQVQPMRTTITSAHYRRLAAAALARRLTAQLFQQANSDARSTGL